MSEKPSESPPRFVTRHCWHCGGGIEFDANGLAENETCWVECPHCHKETTISLPEQKASPVISGKNFDAPPAPLEPPCLVGVHCFRCGSGFNIVASDLAENKMGVSKCPHCKNEATISMPEQQKWAYDLGLTRIREGDYQGAVRRFKDASEMGHPEAQYQLGICYMDGLGVEKNEAEALKWWQESAEQGNPDALLRLRIAQAQSEGVPPDKSPIIGTEKLQDDINSAKVFDNVTTADAKFAYDLGLNRIEDQDYVCAAKCFTNAAKLGHIEAKYLLGMCYMDGLGVEKNEAEAVKWISDAAQHGNRFAEYSLGLSYFNGLGVSRDFQVALNWWRKAADHGNPDAQHKLGICYENGEGVTQNYVQAYKWMKLAAANAHDGASQKCEEIVLKMNAEQIAEAAPHHQKLWQRERLALKTLSDFIGQTRIKSRLELAMAAARSRREALHHILLIGSPGSGKATLAKIIARVMGVSLKTTSGPTITKSSDLAGLLTDLEAGDVLFVDEIHRTLRIIEEYLYPAMKDFLLDIIIDQGPNAREVRLNLPHFTLIGSTTTRERVTPNLLSCFRVIEHMEDYSSNELAAIARRFTTLIEVEIDAEALDKIARSADGTPMDVLNRLQHVRDYAHVKGDGKITLAVAEAALKMLASSEEKQDARESREAIPSTVRREVWRRDEGKCVKCGSRKNLEYDHIIPVAEGGSNTARNIELLCEACNRAKSDLIQ